MIEVTDPEVSELTAQIARDVATFGLALLAAVDVVASVHGRASHATPELAPLPALLAEGGTALLQLAGVLDQSVLVEREEWLAVRDSVEQQRRDSAPVDGRSEDRRDDSGQNDRHHDEQADADLDVVPGAVIELQLHGVSPASGDDPDRTPEQAMPMARLVKPCPST